MNAETKPTAITEPDLVYIPKQYIPRVLPVVEGWLRGIVERSHGALSLEGIVGAWASDRWQLWVINTPSGIKGVMATELHIQNSGRKACSVHFLTGEDSATWLHLVDKLEDWARQQGCGVLDMLARKGWAKRLPDFHMSHVFLEKELI